MIAKRVPMQKLHKSSFAGLASYITSAQGKQERVAKVSITNCESDTLEWAIKEIEATQEQNTRAKSDKTYHLMVSFRAGEHPSDEVLRAIEERICDGLGYGEHQRISAVHNDTDNLHIHIAINKIHPTRLTILEPYYDKRTLLKLCAELEIAHGLQVDNHQPKADAARTRASDMEQAGGMESLIGWIKRQCLPALDGAQTWGEMHEVLATHGLQMRRRANGLVVSNDSGVVVKASSIRRDMSLSALEKRFGSFQEIAAGPGDLARAEAPATTMEREQGDDGLRTWMRTDAGQGEANGNTPASPRYERRPMSSQIDTSRLYERYQDFHQQNKASRSAAWAAEVKRRDRLIAEVKRKAKIKRGLLGMTRGISRKILLAMVSKTLTNDIAKINQDYHNAKKTLFATSQRPTWTDWLQQQARAGDAEAIAALRARKPRTPPVGNTVAPVGAAPVNVLAEPNPDSVTRKGTVIYRAGAGAIRDNGQHIQVPPVPSQAELSKALHIAAARSGGVALDVNGTPSFKDRLAVTAATSNINVSFKNPQLERRRQVVKRTVSVRQSKLTLRAAGARLLGLLAKQAAPPLARKALRYLQDVVQREPPKKIPPRPYTRTITKEKANVRRDDAPARRTNGAATPARPSRSFPGERYRGTTDGKPNIGRVGTVPPPSSRYRLRDMSERSLVLGAEAGPVLLPGDVPDHVGQHQAEGDRLLRRDIRGAGGGIRADEAAEAYIAERNAKRSRITDIPEHKRYNDRYGQDFIFAGLRSVDGQQLALLKAGEEIYVLQIDPKDAAAFKRVKVGAGVEITDKGKLKRKGRTQ